MSNESARQSELDGIRAVAVLTVVLFHCRVTGFDNGFLGVDVFFVLSGFLITRLLLREHAHSGRISLSAFWSRRIRRIFPTLFLTLGVTLALARWLAPPWEWEPALTSARAAAMSISNIHFWDQPGGYFAETVAHQPLLHTWSLGVEEQFYLVWPIAMLVALRFGGRRTAAWWIGIAASASFATSFLLSADSPTAAFYLPHSRVWELAMGAVVAVAGPAITRHTSAALRSVVGWVALAAVTYSLTVGPDWRVPVPSALIPVLGTAALIIAVDTPTTKSVGRILAWSPFVVIGRWSYSWYLFHWPAIVFVQIAIGRHSVGLELLACLAALALAGLNWRFVERPFASRSLAERAEPRLVVLVGVLASAAVAVGVTVMVPSATADDDASDGVTIITSDTFDPPTSTSAPAESEPFDWQSDEGLRILEASRENVVWPCIDFTFHPVLDPACVALPGERSIVVIGDSHASSAAMAVAPIARAANLGLIVVGQPSCAVAGVEVWIDAQRYGGCYEWAMQLVDDITANSDRFAAVVWTARSDLYFPGPSIGNSLDLGEVDIGDVATFTTDVETAEALWRDGVAAIAERFSAAGIPVVLLHNGPELHQWPSDCIAAKSADECAASRDELDPYREPALRAETAAIADTPLLVAIDPYTILCDALSCPVVNDRDVLYRDDNHLSPQGALLLTPTFLEALRSMQVVADTVMR